MDNSSGVIADDGVICSSSGNVWDNAAIDSFFSSVRTGRLSRKEFRLRNEAKADMFEYVERFYNPKQHQLTTGYLEPYGVREAN